MWRDIFGPFFDLELVRSARRKRFYVQRSFFAGVVFVAFLAAFWLVMVDELWQVPLGMRKLSPYAHLADSFFQLFSFIQLTAVLLLTPSFVAPTLASEKQKGNIPLLLTTDLNGWEMLVGKVFARAMTVLAFTLAGVPVIAISSFFGGLDLVQLFLLAVIALSTLAAVVGISALFSVLSSSSRRALGRSYFVIALLLSLPILASVARAKMPAGMRMQSLLQKVDQYSRACNPYLVFSDVLSGNPDEIWPHCTQFVSGCLTLSLFCLVTGSMLTRPICRRGIMREVRVKRPFGPFVRFRRLWVRQIGRSPMLWKDWYFERRTGSSLGLAAFQIVGITAVLYFTLQLVPFSNWTKQGLWDPWSLNEYLQYALPPVFVVTLLSVGVRGSSSFELERKYNGLPILLLTDLSPREIVHAKCIASLKPMIHLLAFLIPALAIATIRDAISPLSVLMVLVPFVVYGILIAAVGCFASLRWQSTTAASAWTMSVLFAAVVGGNILINIWFIPPIMALVNTFGLRWTLLKDIVAATIPLNMIRWSVFRDQDLLFTGESFVLVGYALFNLILIALVSRYLLAHCVSRFADYCGRSDSGETRSISKEEIRGLALAEDSLMPSLMARQSGELLANP